MGRCSSAETNLRHASQIQLHNDDYHDDTNDDNDDDYDDDDDDDDDNDDNDDEPAHPQAPAQHSVALSSQQFEQTQRPRAGNKNFFICNLLILIDLEGDSLQPF